MPKIVKIIGIICYLFNFRFSKNHRRNETWQYKYLNTVQSNIYAEKLTSLN